MLLAANSCGSCSMVQLRIQSKGYFVKADGASNGGGNNTVGDIVGDVLYRGPEAVVVGSFKRMRK
jgi:hypothetical protein